LTDTLHPTNGEWELFDPLVYPPPAGASLLVINPGGVLTISQWYEGALAWGKKPKIPATVKARLTQKQQQQSENSNDSESASRTLDYVASRR
jgi:hypothetical protein